MKTKCLFLLLYLITIISCTSIEERFTNVKEKVKTFSQEKGIIIKNNPETLIDTTKYRNRNIEKVIDQVPNEIITGIKTRPDKYLKDLVNILIENEEDPFIKIKIIHDWICDNISYDTDSFFSGNISDTDYYSVLKTGKSVCSGYSNLFFTMSRIAGFKSYMILGDAKGYGYNPFLINSFDSNHAWNSVQIEKNWYLVDCTWDAGHVHNSKFIKDYNTSYLFLDTNKMIFTHFPEDPTWQLINDNINYINYSELHPLNGLFFDYLSLDNDIKKTITSDNLLQITLDKQKECNITIQLENENMIEIENRTYVSNNSKEAILYASFPKEGKYLIRLFVKDENSSEYLGEFIIFSNSGSNYCIQLFILLS